MGKGKGEALGLFRLFIVAGDGEGEPGPSPRGACPGLFPDLPRSRIGKGGDAAAPRWVSARDIRLDRSTRRGFQLPSLLLSFPALRWGRGGENKTNHKTKKVFFLPRDVPWAPKRSARPPRPGCARCCPELGRQVAQSRRGGGPMRGNGDGASRGVPGRWRPVRASSGHPLGGSCAAVRTGGTPWSSPGFVFSTSPGGGSAAVTPQVSPVMSILWSVCFLLSQPVLAACATVVPLAKG